MSAHIPLVDYLCLREKPDLTANGCINCGARFFGRRNACANCFGTEFNTVDLDTDGGTSVNANIINTPADSEHISLGMKVTLATYSMGKDDHGIEAIGFGFEPAV
ncbi:MAG: hypothetical protein CMK34_05190 [Porticoccaceae bacterium]|nr:hypothetical protein [Porticoccaceae bacterium]